MSAQAREDFPKEQGQAGTAENGSFVCHVVRDDILYKLSRHLIDSTVEKFGGGE